MTGEKWLALRTIGSTALGAILDTIAFALLAWAFTLPMKDIIEMIASTFVIKMVYECLIATPLVLAGIPVIEKSVEIESQN